MVKFHHKFYNLFKECQKWSKYKEEIIKALIEDYTIDDDKIEELEDPYLKIEDAGQAY